jgi:hypothetical protein
MIPAPFVITRPVAQRRVEHLFADFFLVGYDTWNRSKIHPQSAQTGWAEKRKAA